MFSKIDYQVFHSFPHILSRSIWCKENSMPAAEKILDEHRLLQDFLEESSFSANHLISAKQVHGNHIEQVHGIGVVENCDGLLTTEKNMPLAIRTADCAAVMMYAQSEDTVVNLHVGWRGAAAGIIGKAVHLLAKDQINSTKQIWVAVGPLIRECCYEVGPEFYHTFDEQYLESRNKTIYFHLQNVIQSQLSDAGIWPEQLEFSGECTFCSPLGLPSYRRDNTGQRIINIIENKGESQ
ncbi:MAG: peptidoglycan editing factor PgeF [bacterium]|nr:MAG: peptidoglycan editing factor PgeF [bacterium]